MNRIASETATSQNLGAMHRRDFLKAGLAVAAGLGPVVRGAAAPAPVTASAPGATDCDVFVYGSTPGGIAAAVEAARRGCRVVLACPRKNPGGMAASGLCTTDAVRKDLFGGFVAEFIGKVRARYRRTLAGNPKEYKLVHDGWFYEPSVAEAVFREILAGEERLRWLPGCWLTGAAVAGGRIQSVTLETPQGKPLTLAARTFIDATYEGDLAAAAKVPCRVGREGREEFGEPRAGIHYMDFRTGKQIMTPDTGEPSIAIQSFCYRGILTTDPAHRVPIEKPASYDEHLADYLPLIDDFKSGHARVGIFPGAALPNRKHNTKGNIEGLTSLNCPGVSWAYPEAGRRHRDALDRFHRDHAAGLIYFLQHDPHVPAPFAENARRFGLHDQEFKDNGFWPWQLYVRQGRRIEGRAIVTAHNFTVDPKSGQTPRVAQAIALGEHSFDVHPCHDRRYAVNGFMEGVLWYPKKAEGPAQPGQIPYGALLPRHIENLLVPVALSCTHLAMAVIRMEPVWMTTGQVAGLAATMAQEKKMDVAQLDPEPLPAMLKIKTVYRRG